MKTNDDFYEKEKIYEGSNNTEEIDLRPGYYNDADSAIKKPKSWKVVELCCAMPVIDVFRYWCRSVFVVHQLQAGVNMKDQ